MHLCSLNIMQVSLSAFLIIHDTIVTNSNTTGGKVQNKLHLAIHIYEEFGLNLSQSSTCYFGKRTIGSIPWSTSGAATSGTIAFRMRRPIYVLTCNLLIWYCKCLLFEHIVHALVALRPLDTQVSARKDHAQISEVSWKWCQQGKPRMWTDPPMWNRSRLHGKNWKYTHILIFNLIQSIAL